MHDAAPAAPPLVRLRPVTAIAFALFLGTYLALMLYGATFRTLEGGPKIDFDIFYIVGRMAWDGTLPDAYTSDLFAQRQIEITGGKAWAPWTYPPQFAALTALLPLMSTGLSFAVFALGTLGAYLLVLHRLAGRHFAAVALAMLPLLVGSLAIGQNGLLTGALAGAFALLALRRSASAGLPLGLMVIKPHLALGLGVAVVLTRSWGALAWAAGVVAVTSLLCTLAFGPAIWPAFLHGVEESKEFMAQGEYYLNLMPSAYAALRSLGLGAGLAAAAQAAVALAGLAALGLAVRQGWERRRLLSAATLASLLVSPYLQHYDLAILGIALALAMPDLAEPPARRLFPAIFAGAWLIAFLISGYWGATLAWARALVGAPVTEADPWSLAGFVFLALAALVLSVLWRAERPPA